MSGGRKDGSFGVLGVGVAACAACCAPPLIGFLAAASLGTLIGVALFGAFGLIAGVIVVVLYLRRRSRPQPAAVPSTVAVSLGRKPDA